MTKLSSFANWLVPLTTACVLGLTLFVAMTFVWTTPTLEHLIISTEKAVPPTADLLVSVDYCKTRNIVPHKGRWSLQNEISILLPDAVFALPIGCSTKQIAVPLPPHVIPGRYRLQVELVYRPWPWVDETVVRQSLPFEVRTQ